MTINETIEKYRNRVEQYKDWENMKDIAEEYEQLIEWLELLKWYHQGMKYIPSESGVLPKDVYRAGYYKAIDNFAETLHNLCGFEVDNIQYPYLLDESRIDEVAEQLKKEQNKEIEEDEPDYELD